MLVAGCWLLTMDPAPSTQKPYPFPPPTISTISLNLDNMSEWSDYWTDYYVSQGMLAPAEPTYNFGLGYEIATATHVFQVFVGSGNYLVPQYNVMKNTNKFFESTKDIFIGFNITRQWNF